MKINGINSKVIELYKSNNVKKNNIKRNEERDSIQISDVGKSLSNFSMEPGIINSKEKIHKITKLVAEGKYDVDSKLIAEKLMNVMKGRDV